MCSACSLSTSSGAALVPEHPLPSWGILAGIMVRMVVVIFHLIN